MNTHKFAIKTLGCKVNQYEEQVIRENLIRFGFEEAGPDSADLVIVNSCTVTSQADIKTKKLIRRLKKDNPAVKIFITGCLAVVKEDIEHLRSLPEVFMVVHNREKSTIPLIVDYVFSGTRSYKEVIEGVSGFSDHTRAFLKIQDGCDLVCTYCKVNIVRGPSISRDEKKILEEVKRLVEGGYKEIVLTGICLGSWKSENGWGLSRLITEIDDIEGNFRIRLSSLEPDHIDEKLIETIVSSRRVCRHLHVPLQSGSDKILRSMKRRYNTDGFRKVINRLRQKMPLIGITMDVIAGFPGETGSDFEKTLNFVREIRPSRMHVFKYSDREGTESFNYKDKVPSDVAKKRVELLIKEGEKLRSEFNDKFLNTEVEVLVETKIDDDFLEGYTSEYVRTKLRSFEGTKGQIVKIKKLDRF